MHSTLYSRLHVCHDWLTVVITLNLKQVNKNLERWRYALKEEEWKSAIDRVCLWMKGRQVEHWGYKEQKSQRGRTSSTQCCLSRKRMTIITRVAATIKGKIYLRVEGPSMLWFEDSSTDKKTGDRTGKSENGQWQELIRLGLRSVVQHRSNNWERKLGSSLRCLDMSRGETVGILVEGDAAARDKTEGINDAVRGYGGSWSEDRGRWRMRWCVVATEQGTSKRRSKQQIVYKI